MFCICQSSHPWLGHVLPSMAGACSAIWHRRLLCCHGSQTAQASSTVSTHPPPSPAPADSSSTTGTPLFKYVFNAALSASRFAGTLWNLTRSANHFSSSGLVITCSGIKGKRGECGKLEGAAGLRIVRRGCGGFANQAAGVRRGCGSCGGCVDRAVGLHTLYISSLDVKQARM